MSTYLVTGVAGFIASKVTEFLLAGGHTVVGVDNLNDAYDVRLKHWRLAQLEGKPGFEFHRLNIANQRELREFWELRDRPPFDAVINLAARAGVRQSVENPWVYFETNVTGTLNPSTSSGQACWICVATTTSRSSCWLLPPACMVKITRCPTERIKIPITRSPPMQLRRRLRRCWVTPTTTCTVLT